MIRSLGKLALLCLCALPVWLALRRPWKRRPLTREAALCAFAVLMAGILLMALDGTWTWPWDMVRSAVSRLRDGTKIHPVPFHTISRQVSILPNMDALTQLLGNTLLFAPWGFFLPLLWRQCRRPRTLLALCLGLTCFIEFTQLFIDRYVEFDDILLNFAGSLFGAGCWWLLHRLWPKSDDLFLA